MTIDVACPAMAIREHRDLAALKAALARHAVWFAVPSEAGLSRLGTALAERIEVHRMAELSCVTVTGLRGDDLGDLHNAARHAFVNIPANVDQAFPDGDVAVRLDRVGFGVFFPHGNQAAVDGRVRCHARIGSLEFLLSRRERLDAYPRITSGMVRSGSAEPPVRRRAVAVLDLVQDFEILQPLLARAAAPSSPFDLCVAVSDRVLKSPIWGKAKLFLDVNAIETFTPLGPVDVASALGQKKSLLLTASESSAAGHVFGHTACRVAPPRALRVTLQHGFECIGLRHHRAHDLDFPRGVRFASDIVLTWDHPDVLPDLHPAEAHKCVPVGVIKAMAERAALLAEQQWQRQGAIDRRPSGGRKTLLIAENLHSVRFHAPARYQRFLSFIRAAHADPTLDVTIRSHPGKRTLESQRESNQMKFLDGVLRTDDLLPFDGFVSPPSTVALDAALAGVPLAIWSDASLSGDAANYAGLPIVTDFADWNARAMADPDLQTLAAMTWALDSTAAFNGVPNAWNTLVQLAS